MGTIYQYNQEYNTDYRFHILYDVEIDAFISLHRHVANGILEITWK